eukprot:NODE_1061_length_1608_cov_0.273691.p2 type:complete len:109 gc:universal NODE_1061_length_1608_cov_0.273691:270-596(+)
MEELKLRCKELIVQLQDSEMTPIDEVITEKTALEESNEDENTNGESLEFHFDLGCGMFEERTLLDEILSNEDNECNEFISEILHAIQQDSEVINSIEESSFDCSSLDS